MVYSILERKLHASLTLGHGSCWCKTFLVTGAVGELAALCVKGKQERVAPRLYAHERNQKLSEIGV